MKHHSITVLAKWQVVIPKEIRDALGICVWDSLQCFMRWSAVVLEKRISTLLYSWSHDQFVLWNDAHWNKIVISLNELQWITYLLWKQWFGKSVHALNMMMNMYASWKSLIVFDPYGDRIAEIKNHIADPSNQSLYAYTLGVDTDWEAFKKKILEDVHQKVIVINTNFQWIWLKQSTELIVPILIDTYSALVNESTAIFLDEFWFYYDEFLWWKIIKSWWYTCILDRWRDYFSQEQIKNLFSSINHFALYQVDWLTAKYLVDDLQFAHSIQELSNTEKYHFYFYSKSNNQLWILLTGNYPF